MVNEILNTSLSDLFEQRNNIENQIQLLAKNTVSCMHCYYYMQYDTIDINKIKICHFSIPYDRWDNFYYTCEKCGEMFEIGFAKLKKILELNNISYNDFLKLNLEEIKPTDIMPVNNKK